MTRLWSPLAALALTLTLSAPAVAPAEEATTPTRHYLFSYFRGNGEDGLHLAHSQDGYQWRPLNRGRSLLRPTAGQDKLMRDPSIVQGPDGTFHMVWTVSWNEKGIGYASSKNLIDWSEQRYIPVMEHEEKALNTWAPEIFYDDATEQFVIVWSTTIPGRFPETDNQSDRAPDGSGYNHRMYMTTTRDFETFTDTALFYDHGFNVIDGAIARDGDRYVLFLKDETNRPYTPQKNIRVAFAENATGPWGPPSDPISGEAWAEGPTYLKIDGVWHVYFDRYTQGRYGVVVSEDLENWTDQSDRLSMPRGMRHGTAFEAPAEIVEELLRWGERGAQEEQ